MVASELHTPSRHPRVCRSHGSAMSRSLHLTATFHIAQLSYSCSDTNSWGRPYGYVAERCSHGAVTSTCCSVKLGTAACTATRHIPTNHHCPTTAVLACHVLLGVDSTSRCSTRAAASLAMVSRSAHSQLAGCARPLSTPVCLPALDLTEPRFLPILVVISLIPLPALCRSTCPSPVPACCERSSSRCFSPSVFCCLSPLLL